MKNLKVGDKIVCVNRAEVAGGHRLEDGKTYKVIEKRYSGVVIHVPGHGGFLVYFHELEEFTTEEAQKKGGNEAELNAILAEIKRLSERAEELVSRPASNRAAVIERARKDVENIEKTMKTNAHHRSEFELVRRKGSLRAQYHINADKGTVVARIHGTYAGMDFGKGIAKLAPGDEYNAHIGKAIALRRALGEPVPTEYTTLGGNA